MVIIYPRRAGEAWIAPPGFSNISEKGFGACFLKFQYMLMYVFHYFPRNADFRPFEVRWPDHLSELTLEKVCEVATATVFAPLM